MIAQYAAAGIVSTLKRLAVPASVDTIPTSGMQEDHVAMGWAAALKLREAIDGLRRVLAIELLVAARALDLRTPLRPAAGTGAAAAALRERVAGPGPDVVVADQIERAVALVAGGDVIVAVQDAVGQLQ
jgi:histidine ammonia-lyase